MKIIVDANIVFSAILNSNGLIGDLLMNLKGVFEFYAPEFLKHEIGNHVDKLLSISGLDLEQLLSAEFAVCRDITFLSEDEIANEFWQNSFKLVSDIDENDTPYLAFVLALNAYLWTGDKKLFRGLEKKGFSQIYSSRELLGIRKEFENRQQNRQ